MPERPSLHGRVALAIALLIGFYGIALGIAAALVFAPYAEWHYANQFTLRLALFCWLGAIAILRGILPRRDVFTEPGPRLDESDHPRLFSTIREIAAATGQRMPEEVYLVPEVNAFVTERGGGIGIYPSRRVMGIGFPLLGVLTVAELRAVVAHEFGHYFGGDTKLGPWIYKTRGAIIRTLQTVSRHSSWLYKPFEWYGVAFQRVTLAISRRQEYVADDLAAHTVGSKHLSSALTKLESSAAAFGAFWSQEYVHVLERGFRPPLNAGFARFRSAPFVRARLDELVTHQLESGVAGPYDSHPSLKERLAELASHAAAGPSREDDDASALTLVDDVSGLEAMLIASLAKAGAPALAPIEWDDVPGRVLVLGWVDLTKPSKPGLDGLTPGMFPEFARRSRTDPDVLVRQLGVPRGRDPDGVRAHADGVLGAALALVLHGRLAQTPETLSLTAPPGEPVVFTVHSDGAPITIEPFAVLPRLREGQMTMGDWVSACSAAGIGGDDLGSAVQPPAKSPQ